MQRHDSEHHKQSIDAKKTLALLREFRSHNQEQLQAAIHFLTHSLNLHFLKLKQNGESFFDHLAWMQSKRIVLKT